MYGFYRELHKRKWKIISWERLLQLKIKIIKRENNSLIAGVKFFKWIDVITVFISLFLSLKVNIGVLYLNIINYVPFVCFVYLFEETNLLNELRTVVQKKTIFYGRLFFSIFFVWIIFFCLWFSSELFFSKILF